VLTVDDVDLIIAVVEDASEDILQRHEAKQETLYERIEKELKDIQQAIYSSLHSTYCAFVIRNCRIGG
jgi:hypothetical protein